MHAKFVSENKIEFAPKVIFEESIYIANPTEATLREHGYKLLIVDEKPELNDNEYVEKVYVNTDSVIEQHWIVKQVEEETIPEDVAENELIEGEQTWQEGN